MQVSTEPITFRLLVTGWRFWPREASWVIHRQLELARWALVGPRNRMIVVDGECPRGGVDLYAHEWALEFIGPEGTERHPAPWKEMGNAAGPQRNQFMVDLGADICFAFPGPVVPGKKGGTRDCIERAEKAGIPVQQFPWKDLYLGG